MGFFSSRKSDNGDPGQPQTKVIRSKFYGKSKPKQSTTAAPALTVVTRNQQESELPIPGPSRAPVTPRKPPPDTATLTLAQRLNELATANTQGLLDDDEYRLLRQDLFDRLGKTSVPTESPVVPVSTPRHGRANSQSQFHIEASPSLRSKASGRSGVASLFMKVTSTRTRSGSQSTHDDHSSIVSNSSGFFKRALSRRGSSSSIKTSVSSQEQAPSGPRSLRSGSKSHGSMRNLATPPSSFNHHYTDVTRVSTIVDESDDERLQSSAEIRIAITSIEAERNRLVDAFNSLELSAQTRHRPALSTDDGEESMWPTTPSRRIADDALSFHSGISPSKSVYSVKGRMLPSSSLTGPFPVTPRSTKSRGPCLSRQTSNTSLRSTSTRGTKAGPTTLTIPPVPPLPHKSNSSLQIVSPLSALSENVEVEYPDALRNVPVQDREMSDLKRRRQEVLRRYDDRLEYMRAKLKGAELREKVMRR